MDVIFAYLTKVLQEKEELLVHAQKKPYVYNPQSDNISELVAAIAKARPFFTPIKATKQIEVNFRTYDYAELADILSSCLPVLAEQGVILTQQIEELDGGAQVVHTKLIHSSGQWIGCHMRVLPTDKSQRQYASALNHAKRHSVLSLLGLAVHDNPEDDDALQADKVITEKYDKGVSLTNKHNPRTDNILTITKEQLEQLNYELNNPVFVDDLEKLTMDICEEYKIRSMADLPKNVYYDVINRIRNIILLRKGERDGTKR